MRKLAIILGKSLVPISPTSELRFLSGPEQIRRTDEASGAGETLNECQTPSDYCRVMFQTPDMSSTPAGGIQDGDEPAARDHVPGRSDHETGRIVRAVSGASELLSHRLSPSPGRSVEAVVLRAQPCALPTRFDFSPTMRSD